MRRRSFDPIFLSAAFFSGLAGLFLLGLVALLVAESLPAWRHEGLPLLTGRVWRYREEVFGALPMLYGTGVVSAVALLIAAPVGIGCALFLAEIAPRRVRLAGKAAVELLAGIPSVVYGLLGVLFLRDWVLGAFAPFEPLSGDTLLTAGLLLSVMVLPTIVSLSEEAFSGVPVPVREAARALGLTRFEALRRAVAPRAAGGLVAALLLALGRALGETIAVFLVVGRADNRLPSPFWSPRPLLEAGQTLTSKLGGAETSIAYGSPLHWGALVALGLILLALTLVMTVAAEWLVLRRRDA